MPHLFKIILLSFFSSLSLLSPFEIAASGFCNEEMATLERVHKSKVNTNRVKFNGLTHFIIKEHNKKEFARVAKAKEKEQAVAGTLHHLTLEEIEAGKKKLYEAKVWVKTWFNFKEL